jgi:hypothetical protein
MFVDAQVLHSLTDAGAYIVTPGWLERFKDYLEIWKFNQQQAREFFSDQLFYSKKVSGYKAYKKKVIPIQE